MPPPGDPSLPVLIQEGRADLVTLHKCADGTDFPCAGKSVDDLVQYVNSSARLAGAAAKAGSTYRAFHPEDMVVRVPGTSVKKLKNLENYGTTGSDKLLWLSGNDVSDFPANDSCEGDIGVIEPGVASYFVLPAGDYDFSYEVKDVTPGGNPGSMSITSRQWAAQRWLDHGAWFELDRKRTNTYDPVRKRDPDDMAF